MTAVPGATARSVIVGALICGLLALLVASPAGAAPAWLAPVSISEEGSNATEPQVAFDGRGDAITVWDRRDGAYSSVESAFRGAGGLWQAPVSLGLCGESRCEPRVAFDANGDAFAAWEAYTGFTFVVETSYRPVGGAWQAPVVVSPAEIPGAAHPQLTVDPKGDAIVVWDRGSPIDAVTQAAFMPAGGSWHPPVDISPEGDSAVEPQVALDGQGDALVLWSHVASYHDYTYEYVVQSAFMPADGPWQAPVNVSTPGLVGGIHFAFDGQGDATAVWDQWTQGFLSTRTVQAALMASDGTWQAPVDITGVAERRTSQKMQARST
jgi:hypothetical protein